MLTAKVHIFSDSVFFTGSGALGLTGARMKSGNCTNRNDIAGPSIETGWHVCLGDTTVQILQRIKSFISENGHEPFNFLDGLIFVSMFHDITNWKCVEEQANVQLKREKWLLTQQASEMVIGVSVVQDLKRHGKIADRSCHHFAEDEWEKLALRMISEFMFSKHLVVKYSNMFQTSVLMKRKKGGGGAGTHFKSEPGNHLMLVDLTVACNRLCLFYAVQDRIQNKMPVQIRISIMELRQEEIAAFAHQKTTCLWWLNICTTMNSRIVGCSRAS